MRALRSQFVAAVAGGVVVAGTFLALGVTGRRSTQTIVEQSPVAASATQADSLTPHAIYARDAPGVVLVKSLDLQDAADPFDLYPQRSDGSTTGSGFLINPRGYILTDYHLIEGADRSTGVQVQFEGNISRRATVVGGDERDDLAVLKVDMRGVAAVKPLTLGDSSSVRVGDPTLAIGDPFGFERTLSSGIVSALQHQISAPDGFAIHDVIQTDAPLDPGNSGGPLIDAAGRVIGINSQITTGEEGTGGGIGIAFAVPIDTAKSLLPRIERRTTR
jgi:S1-C subfamily serine protease